MSWWVLLLVPVAYLLITRWTGTPDTMPEPVPAVVSPTSDTVSVVTAALPGETPTLEAPAVALLSTPTQAQLPTPTQLPDAELPSSDAAIDALLAEMTVEEKLGQLFMVFFEGTSYSPALAQTIEDLHVGGILIFQPNIGGPLEELASVISAAQTTAANTGAKIPLFVGIDHEGGLIDRSSGRLTTFPGPMAIAATNSVENARAVAQVMSKELLALGINMNLAPVMDVNSNPANPVIGSRAFGSTPELVTIFGLAMVDEFQRNNLLATVKHFPGHGDTHLDSHTALPVISKELADLQAVELAPFAEAIAAGADVIMTAHVAVPTLTGDPELPATLSGAVLTDLLRDTMGFKGLIATDSLGMGALDLRYGITQTSALALQAGVDLLMYGADLNHTPVEQYWVFDYLLERINTGELSIARLDESVRRILQAKARRGLLTPHSAFTTAPSAADLASTIRTPEHLALAQRISEQAVTLVKNDADLLPLNPEQRVALIYPDFESDLPSLLNEYTSQLTPLPISIDPGAEERSQVATMAVAADVIIVATVNANFYPRQVALIQELAGQPVVIMALTSPYDLLAFPTVTTYLTTYNDNQPMLAAAAKLLYGQIQPAGTLPVSLPSLFPVGFGLATY
jgi:beta-N-acetylhexosaminidase